MSTIMKKEEHNYYKLGKIVYNEVNEALRNVFSTLWDNEYPTMQWTDDDESVRNFRNMERVLTTRRLSKRAIANLNVLESTHGDRSKWDMSLLMYALIFSKCLDLKVKNNRLYTAIDSLRDIRNNKFAHVTSANCSDSNFRLIYTDIENAIKALPGCAGFKRNIKRIKNETRPPSNDAYIAMKYRIDNDRLRGKCVFTKGAIMHTICMATVCLCIVVMLFIKGDKPARKWALPDPQDWFMGREREIHGTIESIINGSRLHLYKGGTGFGKTSASYVVGTTLFEKHRFDVMFVSLRGTSDVQTVMDEIYRLATGKSVDKIDKFEFMSFLKSFFHTKVLIILDSVDAIFSKNKEIDIMKSLLVNMLKQNRNVYLLCTSQISFFLTTHTVKTTTFIRLSTQESAEVLKKINSDIYMAEALELGELCGGVPILLTLYGHLIHSKNALTASTIISQINKFGVLMAFDDNDVPIKDNVIQMLRAFFCMTNSAVVDAFLKLVSVYPDSFTISAASRVLELSIDDAIMMIGKLEDFSIVTVQAYHTDGTIYRLSIDPLLQQYSTSLATTDLKCLDEMEDTSTTGLYTRGQMCAVLAVPIGIVIWYIVFRCRRDKGTHSSTVSYVQHPDGTFEMTYTQNTSDSNVKPLLIDSSVSDDPAFQMFSRTILENNRLVHRERRHAMRRLPIERGSKVDQ